MLRFSIASIVVGLVACHSSNPKTSHDAPASIDAPVDSGSAAGSATTTPVAAQGPLNGHITDASTSAAIAGATVQLAGTSIASQADGTFSALLATGRTAVSVSAPGYVDWHADVLVAGTPQDLAIALTPVAATTAIAGQGTVTAGPVSVAFPTGSFSGTAHVSATYLDPAAVARGIGRVQFGTQSDHQVHHIVAAISVQTDVEPATPATVTFPIIGGARYTLWQLGTDNEWAQPIAPSTVTASAVSFAVPHFTSFGLSTDTDDTDAAAAMTVVAQDGTVNATDGNGSAVSVAPGAVIPNGSSVVSADNGRLVMVDPQGNVITMERGSTAELATCVDANLCVPATASITVQRGKVGGLSNEALPTTKPKFMFRTRYGLSTGPRGTAFELALPVCSDPSRNIANVSVYEGAVDVTGASVSEQVTAGNESSVCVGCPVGESGCRSSQFQIGAAEFPSNNNTAREYGVDLNGDGTVDNQLGAIVGTGVGMGCYLALSGTGAPIVGELDLADNGSGDARLRLFDSPTTPAGADMQRSAGLANRWVGAANLHVDVAPLKLSAVPVMAVAMSSSAPGGTISSGNLGVVFAPDVVQNTLAPAFCAAMRACNPTGFSQTCGNQCQTCPIIQSLFASDVMINGMPGLSLGVRFSASPAMFTPAP